MAVFVYCLFVFQVGFRWQTGTDWEPYILHFESLNNIKNLYYSLTGFELGYSFLILFLKYIWNSYTFSLVVQAVIYYVLIFSAFKKLTPYLFVSLMVFYATTLGVMGSNRQLLALGICLYAIKYIIDKDSIKFFLLVALAFMFHSSAVLFIVFYFLNKDIKPFIIYTILAVSFIIGKTNFPFFIFSFIGESLGVMGAYKVLVYTGSYQEEVVSLSIFGLIKRFFFIALFMYNYKILTDKLFYYKIIFNGYFVGLVIYALFSSTILILVNRGSLYFTVMEGLLLACQFVIIKEKHYTVNFLILLFIVSILLMFQSISGYADLFIPYKGVFYNSDVFRYRLE
jgi:hypothetical protein